MPNQHAKARLPFPEMCRRLELHGFRLCHLGQFDDLDGLRHLQIVVMNQRNLAVEQTGPCGPPHFGEDLFYQVASKVSLFGN